MRRVLKDSGSIYLHCDPTASHYLKLLMDSIYGQDNFRNEITWRRTNAKSLAFRGYPKNADFLLYYNISDDYTWNRPHLPHDPVYVAKFYRYTEPGTGRRYRLGDLTNPNRDRPNLTYEWNGHTRVVKGGGKVGHVGGRIVNVCVVVATGVNADGQREIPGMDVGATGVELVTSDAHPGWNAIAVVFAGANWQRCRTHFMADLLTRVPKRAQPGVATQDLLAWCAPSTSNCLPQRSMANWTEWWNNSGSPFPRWRSCWPTSMTSGPKPAATSPSPTPSATRHCRSPIYWKQWPDQHQKG